VIFSFMSLSISHLFSFLIHITLSCAVRECMRVTAGVPEQQMNILIRRPLRWRKPGDCTLIAFCPRPSFRRTFRFHFVALCSLSCSSPLHVDLLNLHHAVGQGFYCVHYLTEKHSNLHLLTDIGGSRDFLTSGY
jgi:hypothetical protein